MNSTSFGSRLVNNAARSPFSPAPGRRFDVHRHAHLARDDVRQRRLAEARRAEQQHVIERFAARFRRLDEDGNLAANLFLADVFIQLLRSQRALQRVLLRALASGRDQPLVRVHARRHARGGSAREESIMNGHTGIV